MLGEEFRRGVIEGQLDERVQSEVLACIEQVQKFGTWREENWSQKCKDDGHLVGRPRSGIRGLVCFR